MSIKRTVLKVKGFYASCNDCGRSIDSDEKFMYDGYCRDCYYNRRIF